MRVRLRELRDDELPAWAAAARAFYVDDLQRNGGLSHADAEAKAAADFGALFPEGRRLDDHHLVVVENDAGDPIGRLWFAEKPFGIWLYDVELDERVRGRGLGRATMLALEERARELGAAKVALNVFGGNERARSLYRSLGYVEESVQMAKRLD